MCFLFYFLNNFSEKIKNETKDSKWTRHKKWQKSLRDFKEQHKNISELELKRALRVVWIFTIFIFLKVNKQNQVLNTL